jgi:hypothetical protein
LKALLCEYYISWWKTQRGVLKTTSYITWCFRMSLHFRFRCCWHQQQHKHLSKVEGPSLHIEATMDQQPLWLDEFRIENCEIWHGGIQDNPKLIWFFHWLYYGVFPTGCCRETYQTCKQKTIKNKLERDFELYARVTLKSLISLLISVISNSV